MEECIIARHRLGPLLAISMLTLLVIAIMPAVAIAQPASTGTGPAPALQWSKSYDLGEYTWSEALCHTAGGCYAITGMVGYMGNLYMPIFISTPDGKLLYSRMIVGDGHGHGHSIIQAEDGGFVIAGEDKPQGSLYSDICIVKTDSTGLQQWTRTFGTSGEASTDRAFAVIAADGGYIVAGYLSNIPAGRNDGCLLKYSDNGDLLWNRSYHDPKAWLETFTAIRQTTDGGYVVAGTILPEGEYAYHVYLCKIGRDGNVLWSKSYGTVTADDDVRDVRQTTDGGYIISGGSSNDSLFLNRVDGNGNLLWYREYDCASHGFMGTVEQTPDGGFIAGGACLVRTDDKGNVLWTLLTNTSYFTYKSAFVSNGDGSYTVTGGANVNGLKVLLARTMPEGNVVPGVTQATNPISTPAPASAIPGWIGTLGLALGMLVLIAGTLVIVLIVVLIADDRRNRVRKR